MPFSELVDIYIYIYMHQKNFPKSGSWCMIRSGTIKYNWKDNKDCVCASNSITSIFDPQPYAHPLLLNPLSLAPPVKKKTQITTSPPFHPLVSPFPFGNPPPPGHYQPMNHPLLRLNALVAIVVLTVTHTHAGKMRACALGRVQLVRTVVFPLDLLISGGLSAIRLNCLCVWVYRAGKSGSSNVPWRSGSQLQSLQFPGDRGHGWKL